MTTRPDYWNQIYETEGRPGWDMNGATPLVREVHALAHDLGLHGDAHVVPGCGYGHDALAWDDLGFEVTGLDFAPLAIQGAQARYGDRVQWSQADWFETHLGPWDAIFDHTCLVAMDPPRREAYAAACARHLKPGGLWMAVVFHDVQGRPGPPHAIPMDTLRALAEPHFDVLHLAAANESHPRRAGREYLFIGRKKA
mgnify:CR=1 FL=1